MRVNRGMFIVLEGTDGCGKSTQIRKLKSYLMEQGIYIKLVREPGGTDIGEEVRRILLDKNNKEMTPTAEMYLYAASRAQLVGQVIEPAIKRGKFIICDRFLYSSLVYQGVARGLGVDKVWEANKEAIGDMMPDIAIFLDLPIEKAMKRVKNGNEDRIEQEGINFHKKVYNSYIELCNDKKYNLIKVDADRDIEVIFEEIKSIVNNRMEMMERC